MEHLVEDVDLKVELLTNQIFLKIFTHIRGPRSEVRSEAAMKTQLKATKQPTFALNNKYIPSFNLYSLL